MELWRFELWNMAEKHEEIWVRSVLESSLRGSKDGEENRAAWGRRTGEKNQAPQAEISSLGT